MGTRHAATLGEREIDFKAFTVEAEPAASRIPVTLQLHGLVVIFAATTILGRLISLSAPVLVCWRCLIASIFAFLWVRLTTTKRGSLLDGTTVWNLIWVGGLIGLHWLCLFGAVKVANVSIALAGLATVSVFTALAEPLIERRRIQQHEVWLGVLVMGGIVLIAGSESGSMLGLWLALVSAVLAALFTVFNKQIVLKGIDPMKMVGWQMGSAMFVCLAAVPIFDDFASLAFSNSMDWLWVLILALICTVFAQDWTNKLLRHVSAYRLTLVANFEPVYGILAAALIFREYEELKITFYLGAMAIVLANFLHPLLQKRMS